MTHQTAFITVFFTSLLYSFIFHIQHVSRVGEFECSKERVASFCPTLSLCVPETPPTSAAPSNHTAGFESLTPPDWLMVCMCVCDWQMWTSAAEGTESVSTSVTTPWAVTGAPVVMVTGCRVTTRVWVSDGGFSVQTNIQNTFSLQKKKGVVPVGQTVSRSFHPFILCQK